MVNNLKILNKAALTGWGSRLAVLVFSFVNTRLFIEALGIDGMASYTIILSVTPWIGLLNLGLPITMQNEVSRLRSQGHDIDKFQTYAIGTMLLTGVILVPIPLLFGWAIHAIFLIDYDEFSLTVIMLAVLLIYTSSMFQLLPQLMYANNSPIWPNLYPFFSTFWMFSVLTATLLLEVTNTNVILILVMLSNIVMPLHAAITTKFYKTVQFDLKISLKHIQAAKNILLFTTIATSVLSIDYLIMARILSPADIVKYGIASKLFLIILTLHSVLIAVNWTPVSDRINSKSMKEAKKIIYNILKFGMTAGLICGILIITFQDLIFSLLTGGKVVSIPTSLIVSFLLYTLIRVWTDTFSFGLQSCGKVNLINKFLPIQALISCGGQYYLGIEFGAVGILWGMIISFLITAAWLIPYYFFQITAED